MILIMLTHEEHFYTKNVQKSQSGSNTLHFRISLQIYAFCLNKNEIFSLD